MNVLWWDVLAMYADCVRSFAGCGIVMPLGNILFSQFKLPVSEPVRWDQINAVCGMIRSSVWCLVMFKVCSTVVKGTLLKMG
jgi:hypothetical protein